MPHPDGFVSRAAYDAIYSENQQLRADLQGVRNLGKSIREAFGVTAMNKKSSISAKNPTNVNAIDPAVYFVHADGQPCPIVVEHATGHPVYTVGDNGDLVPYDPGAVRITPSVIVENPPGFTGFPDHDRTDSAFAVETHGLDSADYFTHFEAECPLVVEHATGQAKFKIVDGELIPIES